MARRRVLKRAKLWVVVACVVGVGFTSSQALAEEPPPTEPTPTVPEPPPVTASGPVVTVSSPPTPAPLPKPDPTPVQRKPKLAPAKKPVPARKSAPAPKPAATQAPARVTTPPAQPAPAKPTVPTPTLVPPTPKPVIRIPARPATPAALLRAAKLPRAAQTKKPARAAASAQKARKSPRSTSPLEALARDVPSVPPVSAVERRAAPSGAEQAATSLRWLFVALLGTGAVFITAVGSRRVFDYRARVRLAAAGGHVIARTVPPPEAAAPAPAATAAVPAPQNGNRAPDPDPVVARPAAREAAPAGMCEIGWSRGYFKSDFYVAAPEPEGGMSEVARSPAFRWTAAGEPPQDEAIAAAHAVLVERLVALGWEEVGAGERWYARQYRRRAVTESVR